MKRVKSKETEKDKENNGKRGEGNDPKAKPSPYPQFDQKIMLSLRFLEDIVFGVVKKSKLQAGRRDSKCQFWGKYTEENY